jgi:hypothetical protein
MCSAPAKVRERDDRALEWYGSQVRAAKHLRQSISVSQIVIVDGIR